MSKCPPVPRSTQKRKSTLFQLQEWLCDERACVHWVSVSVHPTFISIFIFILMTYLLWQFSFLFLLSSHNPLTKSLTLCVGRNLGKLHNAQVLICSELGTNNVSFSRSQWRDTSFSRFDLHKTAAFGSHILSDGRWRLFHASCTSAKCQHRKCLPNEMENRNVSLLWHRNGVRPILRRRKIWINRN